MAGVGWQMGGEKDTTVLEQQFKKKKKNPQRGKMP